MKEIFVGIDLGGTNVKIGCFGSQLDLVSKTSVPTDAQMGPQAVVDRVAETVEQMLAENKLSTEAIAAIGIGSPGPAKYSQGLLINLVNLPKFKNVPISQMLKDKFGKPVILENDGNSACYGEYTAGVGKDVKNMVFFTLGTGIGGGIINNGHLLCGSGDNAAELGHVIIHSQGRKCNCGQLGCVEAYASATSTARRATEAVQAGVESTLKNVLDKNGQITCEDVYDHLKAGDKLAEKITDGTAEALAIVCINMLHCTEPERIVFAGGMIAAGDVLLDRINYYFKKHIWDAKDENVKICFAALGEDAGIIGAAALARDSKKADDGS